jgi:hypothetical protein
MVLQHLEVAQAMAAPALDVEYELLLPLIVCTRDIGFDLVTPQCSSYRSCKYG